MPVAVPLPVERLSASPVLPSIPFIFETLGAYLCWGSSHFGGMLFSGACCPVWSSGPGKASGLQLENISQYDPVAIFSDDNVPRLFKNFMRDLKGIAVESLRKKMPKKSLTHCNECQINPILESHTILSAFELLTEGTKGNAGWDFSVWMFLLVVFLSTLQVPELAFGK